MSSSRNKPLDGHTKPKIFQLVSVSVVLIILASGCATSADMDYNFRANETTCRSLSREIAERQHDSDYRRKLNQRYYQNCVGK